MPWMALAFLTGIAIVDTRAEIDGIARCAPFVFVCAALIVLPRVRLVAVVACGILWAMWRADVRLEDRLDPALEGRDLTLAGEVVSIPERGAGRVRFDFVPHTPRAGIPSIVR